jgi:iron(III) transport system substrate-binding protein
MNLSRVSRFFISALVMMAVVPSVSAQSFAELASNDNPGRHQRLVEAARKEGSLTFYTSIPEQDMAVLSTDFEKRYGIRVNVWRASTLKVVQRLVAEKQANRWAFDAVDISSPELEALYQEKLLQEVNSKLHKELIEEALPAHRGWAPQFLSVFGQAYNTNAVKADQSGHRPFERDRRIAQSASPECCTALLRVHDQ